MFFEMCYKPLKTGMERLQILNNIRLKGITLPHDFNCDKSVQNQVEKLS